MYSKRPPSPRYQATSNRFPTRPDYYPQRHPQVHDGYHSDDEKPFGAPPVPRYRMVPPPSVAWCVPSPSTFRQGQPAPPAPFQPVSSRQRVPSPTRFPEERRRRSRSRSRSRTPERHTRRPSSKQRVPSPTRPGRGSFMQRVPSPPPQMSRLRMNGRGNAHVPVNSGSLNQPAARRGLSPQESLANSRSGRMNQQPEHHRAPSFPGGYVSYSVLPEASNQSPPGVNRPDEIKRSLNERASTRRVTTSEPLLRSPPLSGKRPKSVGLSDSFRPSLLSPLGILRDQGYQYRELNEFEFRLVRVFPERKTMIKCEIIHASLEHPPDYVAISYAWGDAGHTRKIELEGSLVPISVSLYGALDAIRQKVESVLVWVDALCIDQSNKDEKTQQVQLMTNIYSTADSVAVWLGPEEDDSNIAAELLRSVADQSSSPEKVSRLLSSRVGKRDLAGVVSLFERDYWKRLWVVQEIFNARSINVYCGSTKLPWSVFQKASQTFSRHRTDLDLYFPGGQRNGRPATVAPTQFSYSQVLVYQGPGSLPNLKSYMELEQGLLLEVLRACRRKLASDPKDKLFGILGVLPEDTRTEFRADYSLSVKDVYTEVVDYLLKTTERVDVICDAIHFPLHTGSANLPSYVPDWSHIPQTAAMGHKYNFAASGDRKAKCGFLDERLNKLEMHAIYLDTISLHGMAVGTLCTLGDYLMAFLHWRALLLGNLDKEPEEFSLMVQDDFCRTLSFGQVPQSWDKENQWMAACYHVFASLLRERLPHMALDRSLASYADAKLSVEIDNRRHFLQKHFGDQMMGRCFCRTSDGRFGMGSGFMLPGDIVVVPLGCSTPVLLRQEGTRGEHRFVGDVYIHGYMHGRAVDELRVGKKELVKYILH
ncbi:heterokaryon incompatibility protein-domain-containing protein [Leptodontidium sp. MPI-SDFR-AT-0119]|nr:heterokaryon incompatibility protein-domain-containing protein [Leptodontidium sp. MPI-SDFR-AT-0119]